MSVEFFLLKVQRGKKRAGKKLLLAVCLWFGKETCQNVHELLINTRPKSNQRVDSRTQLLGATGTLQTQHSSHTGSDLTRG